MTHAGSASFSRTLRATFAVYGFDLVALFAGFAVAYQLGIFRMAPWAIALYPALLGAKSVLDGFLSGRLSTALHLGTVYPRFMGNTKAFYKIVEAVIFLTLVMSLAISAAAMVFGQIFWGIGFLDFPSILAVVAATMSLGLVLLLVTIKVAFVSFKSALDPDTMVYPLMETVSTILITLCYIVVLNLFLNSGSLGVAAALGIGAFNLVFCMVTVPRNLHEQDFVQTINESLAALMSVALIVTLAGTFLQGVDSILGSTGVAFAGAIYTVYPAIVGFVGDAGSVVGSTAVTKLALGILKPKLSSVAHNSKSVLTAWIVSVAMFIAAALLALVITGETTLGNLSTFLLIILVTNLVAITLTVILFHGLSILTFQKGLDPGNFVLPLENAFVFAITSGALFAVLAGLIAALGL
jgi:cation transporter-like permease